MRQHGRFTQRIVLAALLLVTVTLYVALLSVFEMQVRSEDQVFGAQADTPDRLDLHLELFELDPARLTATIRVAVVPGGGMRGTRAAAPKKDVLIIIRVGNTVQDLVFPANERMATTDLQVDIETGSLLHYPFEQYASQMRWRAFEGTPAQRGHEIPLRFYTYETSPVFDAAMRQAKLASPGDVTVSLTASRPAVIRWFAAAIYLSMAAVGAGALSIGVLLLTRRRRLEATLLGALCAMMFAVPVMRNTLPGNPPLGVAGDLVIFLWAELAVVFGLLMGIATWVRDSVRPE